VVQFAAAKAALAAAAAAAATAHPQTFLCIITSLAGMHGQSAVSYQPARTGERASGG